MYDLMPCAKLHDIVTNKDIGYLFMYDMDTQSKIALSASKVKELDFDCASFIEFAEADEIPVVSYRGRYALVDNCLMFLKDKEDISYEEDDGKIYLSGYMFEKYHLVELDSDYMIKQMQAILG